MGFRPVYDTYVDVVIEHLGGKSFREMAVEELLARVARVVKPSCWSKVKTELKKDRIVFPEIIRFDDYYIQYNNRCKNQLQLWRGFGNPVRRHRLRCGRHTEREFKDDHPFR